ncbi:hypothetical protein AGLY_010007 [Aphis glycines]|uniref:Uncharacterized protein n=1 Tax=Aphis glycines TaxID=307491 RepID=A0A6G0TG65_APHGL|nr:hypothetical protein AGLY_010007 [Aphis glycines]
MEAFRQKNKNNFVVARKVYTDDKPPAPRSAADEIMTSSKLRSCSHRTVRLAKASDRIDNNFIFSLITSRNNAPISNYGGGFRCKSEYPWCIIKVTQNQFSTKSIFFMVFKFLRNLSKMRKLATFEVQILTKILYLIKKTKIPKLDFQRKNTINEYTGSSIKMSRGIIPYLKNNNMSLTLSGMVQW